MSLPNSVVLKTDEKLNFIDASNVQLGTHSGYSSITQTSYPPTGGNSDFKNKTYNITDNNLTDSDIKGRVSLSFIVKKPDNAVDPLEIENLIGLASFPLNRAISNCKVDFKRKSFNTSVARDVNLYSVSLPDEIAFEISPAYYPSYTSVFDQEALDNPLRTIEDSSKPYSTARGLGTNYDVKLELVKVPGPDDTKPEVGARDYLKVNLQWDEKIMAQPFQFREKNPHPFVSLGAYTIKMDFVPDALNAMVKCAHPDYTIEPDTAPFSLDILTNTYSPHLQVEIPSTIYYNSPIVEQFEQTVNQLVAPGGRLTNQTMNSISREGVPSMFAFCVYDPESVDNVLEPFKTLSLDKVSLKINDKPALLSELNSRALFRISQKNGYKLGYSSFSGQPRDPLNAVGNDAYNSGYGTNCWFFFTMADLASEDDLVANANKLMNITLTYDAVNNTGEPVQNPTGLLKLVSDNVIFSQAGNWDSTLPLLTSEQVSTAKVEFEDSDKSAYALGGKGKFWRGLKRFGQKVGRFITSKPVKSAVRAVRNAPGVSELIPHRAHQVADKLGYGVNAIAGKVQKRRGAGVSRKGGKSLSKAQLRKMAGM